MRPLLKRALEACTLGAARLGGNRRTRGRLLILAYHNIVPSGERSVGDRSLHLPQAAFAAQLDLLATLAEVVSVETALEPGPSDRARVAITWDDAYRGAVTAGIDEVTARSLPATMFVAPGMLDGRTFWWDAIAENDLDPRRRDLALSEGRGDTDRVRTLAAAQNWAWHPMPDYATTATASLLLQAAARPGILLGSHTWSHPNLSALDPLSARQEIERAAAWIGSDAPTGLNWLAYPYGMESRAIRGIAREVGLTAAVAIDGGWCPAGQPEDRYRISRLNVPAGISLRGFELRLRGWLAR